MAKKVAVISGKGGTSKTTTSVNVGARLGELGRGERVLVVDADSQDGASAAWYLRRCQIGSGVQVATYEPEPGTDRDQREDDLVALLRRIPEVGGWDWILIDTIPILDSPVVQTAIDIADYLLLPSGVGAGDIARLVQTVKAVAKPSGTPFGIVLSNVDPRSMREAELAAAALAGIDAPVLGVVRSYASIRRAAARGLVAGQFEGESADRALADFEAITAALVAAFDPPAPPLRLDQLIAGD